MLENEQPGHQPRRQRRLPGSHPTHRAEASRQKVPIDLPRQPHQRMAKVDDLLERRAKQVVLAIVARLAHRSPPTANLAVEGITDHPNRESQAERKPCKIDYLLRSNHRDRSIASEFFTEDRFSRNPHRGKVCCGCGPAQSCRRHPYNWLGSIPAWRAEPPRRRQQRCRYEHSFSSALQRRKSKHIRTQVRLKFNHARVFRRPVRLVSTPATAVRKSPACLIVSEMPSTRLRVSSSSLFASSTCPRRYFTCAELSSAFKVKSTARVSTATSSSIASRSAFRSFFSASVNLLPDATFSAICVSRSPNRSISLWI